MKCDFEVSYFEKSRFNFLIIFVDLIILPNNTNVFSFGVGLDDLRKNLERNLYFSGRNLST